MEAERPFASDFDFELLGELPSRRERRFFFPGSSQTGGRDGLNIRIVPLNGDPWIGTFAFGRFGVSGVTRVVSAPNPSQLCVIADGQAYLADAYEPETCENIAFVPVFDMRTSAKHRLLILTNFGAVMAIGPAGEAWRCDRQLWDRVTLTAMTDDALSGVLWEDRTGGTEQTFFIDLASGSLSLDP